MKILRVLPVFVIPVLLALPVPFSHANVEKVET
jgi:hypothetical protein